MKILPKHYAIALYDLVSEAKKDETPKLVADFLAYLKKENSLNKINDILREFGRIWNERKGVVEAEIITAKKIDDETIALINDYIAKLSSSVFVESKERLDKDILGGVIMKVGDKVIDGSLRTRLQELRGEMIK